MGPRADLPQSHKPHRSGVRGKSSLRSILSATRALNPASSPHRSPSEVGGRRSKCKGSRCWSLSFIFREWVGRKPGRRGRLGDPQGSQ